MRLRAVSVLLAMAAVAFVGCIALAAQDYTQWRGELRDGAASGLNEPSTWPKALTRVWKVAVGEGYATPLLVGDTVFTFTRRDGSETITALDAGTGAVRWRAGYPAPYTPSQPAQAHGAWPKATPLYREGRLFTLGISGIVSAFDVAGRKLLWQIPASGEPPFFGAAASPAADADLVLVHPGSYGPLTAFDAATGAVKWKAGSDGFFASPIVVSIGGTRQVVTATTDSVIGVALDGRLLWRHPWNGGGGSTTPVVNGDTVVVSGLDQGMAAFNPVKRGENWSTEPVWDTKDISMYLSNPVVMDDVIYGLSHKARGQFFAVDAKTGKVLWLGQPREAENAAVVKAGNRLVLLKDDGELIVARASRTGFEPIARYTVADNPTWAQPAISGHRIFIKDTTSVSLWLVE